MNYDLEYHENMLRMYSKTAEDISRIRWEWIAQAQAKTVLDYGAGVGWFRAYRPPGVTVHSFDVNPAAPQTGLELIIYDVTCFWDVLEHVPDFSVIEPVLRLSDYVACSVPILPANQELLTWRHYKPGEHLHYFSIDSLVALFKRYGFDLVKHAQAECPPRVDITSFLFRRNHCEKLF